MHDWIAFRSYSTFTGATAPMDVCRRNGHVNAAFRRDWSEESLAGPQVPFAQKRTLLSGLTRCERRTWRRLLDAWTIDAIAQADGVSRAAVYARIRGTRGRGGMVRKNSWVRRWWRARHEPT